MHEQFAALINSFVGENITLILRLSANKVAANR
jgi:hypothetical protein